MSRVVLAASSGTVFEYYDFLLYGSLVTFFGGLFFPPGNSTAALLASLATFGAGFAIRPLGAMIFGRLGDRVGRKRTFLITIVLMGLSTALVGVLPSYEAIGWWAPALLVTLRLLQGLALGGEFGGAAIYIAEHCDDERRGYYTSWIQTTATMGLIASLLVIVACRSLLGDEAFRDWGWRIPFLLSSLLLVLSIYVRTRISESPAFEALRAQGGLSDSPVSESLLGKANRGALLAAIVVAATMALSWYTAQFYCLVFMQTVLLIDVTSASLVIVVALALGILTYLFAGILSDRIGRRPVMLAGMLLVTLSIIPAYRGMLTVGNPALDTLRTSAPVTVFAAAPTFDPFAMQAPDDASKVRDLLAKRGISYGNVPARDDANVIVRIGSRELRGFDRDALNSALASEGYPERSPLAPIRGLGDFDLPHAKLAAIILFLIVGAGLTCGPGAAWLAEIFPTRIRYTSLSVPYHLTSAWFGGFMPLTATWLVARSGDVLAGLWYPVIVMGTGFVLSVVLMRETRIVR